MADTLLPIASESDIEILAETRQVPYREALETMTERNTAIAEGRARELIWLLEHAPVYTAGKIGRAHV